MNNLPEKDENLVANDEFSTVFSDPTEHRKIVVKDKKNRLKIGLSLLLAVAVLVGGTFAVVKLIPEKEVETTPLNKKIMILEYDIEDCEKVSVKNQNGTFELLSKIVKDTDEQDGEVVEKKAWYMKGYKESMTDSDLIESVVITLGDISAIREITTRSKKECGLTNPVIEAKIWLDKEEITVSIGGKSPDNAGVYLMLSTSDKIYLVGDDLQEDLSFADLDMATTETQPGITLPDKYSHYYESGNLTRFDSITITGKNFPEKMEFVQNQDDNISGYVPYSVVKPTKRTAENVPGLFSVFSTGFSVQGAYAYDASKATVNALGLNNPDFVLSAHFGSYTYSYKFKQQEDGDYAVIGNDSEYVPKVSLTDCGFLSYTTTDFYSQSVFLTPIAGLKNLTLKTEDKTYSFNISENPSSDGETDMFIIECDGKNYNSSYFQSYYQYLCLLKCMDFDVKKTNLKPEFTIIYTYDDKKHEPTKIEFVKLNATKYQYSIDGVPMGKVGATSFKKVYRLLDKLLAGKPVDIN